MSNNNSPKFTGLSTIKGFTLIELLVVIVIIGILATLATVALSSARSKARDARRVSDVRQIRTALELYFNDNGSYPTTAAIAPGLSIVSLGNTYMAKIPGNPAPYNEGNCPSNAAYTYSQDNSGVSYTMLYCLFGITGQVPAGTSRATPAGIM